MARFLQLLIALVLLSDAVAQTAPDTYWVQFTDKSSTPYSLSQPEQFLSARSIARRQAQGIALDESDLPGDPAYIAGVLATGDVQLINRSKWFNAITIRTTDGTALDAIAALPFVNQVRSTTRLVGTRPSPEELPVAPINGARGGEPEEYGASWLQISMLNGHLLHAMEAKGEGMLIGVLDSGFDQVDSLPAFADLRAREGILLTRDMTNNDGDVYADHWHGRSVLSFMTGILPGYLQGTAPKADYVLLRTEIAAMAGTGYEFIVEEDNWVAGAELCDSIGCDVLNTSLGYTEFDSIVQNHTYADLDGMTTRISIAAGMASQKGMIPVNSAGNSGNSSWHYISAPADAIDILAVGAVGGFEQHAPFSSFGPSADGRVKPDVCAMGWGAVGLREQGDSTAAISGTSFSSPILAGLVACLWQLNPGHTAQEVMHAVRESASLYLAPNDSMGYGIPNFLVANHLLELLAQEETEVQSGVRVFPVPFTDRLAVEFLGVPGSVSLTLFDATGRALHAQSTSAISGRLEVASDVLGPLTSGIYVLALESGGVTTMHRVVKR